MSGNTALASEFEELGRLGIPLTPAEMFLREVVEPVFGAIPPSLHVEMTDLGDSLTLRHKAVDEKSQQEISFEYVIEFGGEYLETPDLVRLNEANYMSVPLPEEVSWERSEIEQLKQAMRKLLVADPLNPRFRGQMTLLDYQDNAKDELLHDIESKGKGLAVMATATGKTVVAFATIKEYLDRLALLKPDSEAGAVIFMVNNNFILSQAEQTLHRMYPGKFTTSAVYEGSADFSGDVIFATPASLLSGDRLEELLSQRKIAGVIFDEVHHVPAVNNKEIYRRIEEESLGGNWGTIFLGFTATEVRPDKASVVALFGTRVTTEYRIQQAREEGALVPMVYTNCDGDINPNGQDRIHPEHPHHEKYRNQVYSDDRFPLLKAEYHRVTASLIDRRGIIIAKDVERSEAIAQFFSADQGDGLGPLPCVSLTSTARTRDKKRFDHSYYAWKNGAWPVGVKELGQKPGEESPYKDEPVPLIASTVDIFKEGIDVPNINTVLLWRNTNSIITFLQSIGRGLRLAPFKTHLNVIDAVGLFRKLHILRHLNDFLIPRREKKKDEPQQEHGARTDEATTASHLASKDVTQVVTKYWRDIPERLLERYQVPSQIPAEELIESLDPWIAQQAGFLDTNATNKEVRAEGRRLMLEDLKQVAQFCKKEDLSLEEIYEVRARYIPAIAGDQILTGEDVNENDRHGYDSVLSPYEASKKLVFDRLLTLLNRLSDEEIAVSDLARIFHEYDPKILEQIERRGENIKFVRKVVFKKDPFEMAMELVEDFERLAVMNTREFGTALLMAQHLRVESVSNPSLVRDTVLGAEGGKTRVAKGAGYLWSDAEYYEGTINEDQPSLIAMYLLHGSFRNKGLTMEDFDLPHDEFKARLQDVGILSSRTIVKDIIARAHQTLSDYIISVETKEGDSIELAAKATQLLNAPGFAQLIDGVSLTPSDLEKLYVAHNRLSEMSKATDGNFTAVDSELLRTFDELLKDAHLQWTQLVHGMPGTAIRFRRSPFDATHYDVTVESVDESLQDLSRISPLNLFVRPDLLSRTHLAVSPGTRVNQFTHAMRAVGPEHYHGLCDALVEGFEHVAEIRSGSFVIILPRESYVKRGEDDPSLALDAQTIDRRGPYGTLLDFVLRETGHDIIPHIDIDPKLDETNMEYSFTAVARGRLSFLNQAEVMAQKKRKHDNNWSFGGRLSYLYTTYYEYTQEVLPKWNVVRQKLVSFEPSTEIERNARDRLIELFEMQITRHVTGPKRLSAMNTAMMLIGTGAKPVEPFDLKVAALNTLLSFGFVFEGITRDERNALLKLCAEWNGLKRELRRLGKRPKVDEMDAIVTKALSEIFGEGRFSSTTVVDTEALRNKFGERKLAAAKEADNVAREGASTSTEILPPFFTPSGNIKIWLEKPNTGNPADGRTISGLAKPMAHWDPECPHLKQAQSKSAEIATEKGRDPKLVQLQSHYSDIKRGYHLCQHCRGSEPNKKGTESFRIWSEQERLINQGVLVVDAHGNAVRKK